MNEREKQYTIDVLAAMAERTIKRLWVIIIILIVLLAATNGAWIWFENQFEEQVVSQDVDTGEGDAYVNGIGDVYYGENQADGKAPGP